jgi:hypothetical protein
MSETNDEKMYRQVLWLLNSGSEPLRLTLEPWGVVTDLVPGKRYEVVADGPVGDCLEAEFNGTAVFVYGWSGSVVSVFLDGKEVL